MEEVDDFHQGLLGLVLTGHVLEGDAGGFFHIDLGVGLAHAPQAAAHFPGHIAEQEGEQHHHEHHRQDIAQEHGHQRGQGLLIGGAVLHHAVFLQQGNQVVVPDVGLGEGGAVVGFLRTLIELLKGGQLELKLSLEGVGVRGGGGRLRRSSRALGLLRLGVDDIPGGGQLHRLHLSVHNHLTELTIGNFLGVGGAGHGNHGPVGKQEHQRAHNGAD